MMSRPWRRYSPGFLGAIVVLVLSTNCAVVVGGALDLAAVGRAFWSPQPTSASATKATMTRAMDAPLGLFDQPSLAATLPTLRDRTPRVSEELAPGVHPLGLGDGRDGLIYVPDADGRPPLLVFLHGAT